MAVIRANWVSTLRSMVCFMALAMALVPAKADPVAEIASPGKVLAVEVQIDGDGRPTYSVTRNGKAVIQPSRLGFLLTDQPKLERRLDEVHRMGKTDLPLAGAEGRLKLRDGGLLILARDLNGDAAALVRAQSQHRDHALGVGSLRPVLKADPRFELLGQVDQHLCGPRMQSGRILDD